MESPSNQPRLSRRHRAPPRRSRSHQPPPSPVLALPLPRESPDPSLPPGWRVPQPGSPSQALPRCQLAASWPRAPKLLPPALPRRPVAVVAGRRTTTAALRLLERPGSTRASFGLALVVVVALLVAAAAVAWACRHPASAPWQPQREPPQRERPLQRESLRLPRRPLPRAHGGTRRPWPPPHS